jgi:3',5'-cyclic AMP phosphodiesterase CpdA
MFTIAHLSDAHLNPLPAFAWHQLLGKRAIGYVNWRLRRRHLHNMDVLAALVADIRAHQPDHVAMSGDVAHIGLAAEFTAAVPFLDSLGPRATVSFVPGNHDAYVGESLPVCMAALGPWATSDDGARGFPWLKVRGHVALVGLNSAVPTLPFAATGTLGEAQIEQAAVLLHYARSRGLIRVIMVHHAPHVGGSLPGRNLTDAQGFEAMLARCGAELVLHGHNHVTSVALRPGPDATVPVIGVASCSAHDDGLHEPAAWHLIRVPGPGDGGAISIVRRRFNANGHFVDETVLDLTAPVP